ncbi:S-layer homology domain-containing protein, partial [Ructibacterium gallinarum]
MKRIISIVCICVMMLTVAVHAAGEETGAGAGRIEAEDMQLDGYYVVQEKNASGGKYIKLKTREQREQVWGSAEFTFEGETGVYNIDIVYPDYYSGSSTRKLYINGEQKSIWSGKITYGASVWGSSTEYEPGIIRTKTVKEVVLQTGDKIRIESKTDYGEYGELDYVEVYQGDREENGQEKVEFTDIEGLEEEEAILALAEAGIVQGNGEEKFYPEERCTIDTALVMLVRMMGYKEESEDEWAQGSREKAKQKGWVTEEELARGEETITEAEIGEIFSRVPEIQKVGGKVGDREEGLSRREAASVFYEVKKSLDTLLPDVNGTPSYPLDELGYIKNWLYTGMVATEVYEGGNDANTALSEAQNRPMTVTVPDNETFSVELENGMEFRPYPMGKTGMLNEVTRGGDPDLMYVEGYLCADLVVEKDMQVNAKLQMARGYNEVYLNGSKVTSMLYQWTRNTSVSFVMNLKAGKNRIFVRLNGLQGNIITTTAGIQILDHTEEIRVEPPALEKESIEAFGAEDWSFDLTLEDGKLKAASPPPAGASILAGSEEYVWPKYSSQFDFAEEMNGEKPLDIIVRAKTEDNEISRTLKLVQNYEIKRTNYESLEEHQKHYRQTLIEEGGRDWDYIQLMLLKLSENMELTTEDNDKIMDALTSMDMLGDCAEFTMVHAQRLMLLYSDKVEERVRDKLKE